MSRRKKNHIAGLMPALADYANARSLEFHVYSAYHMRLMDGGYVVLDVWTTGRYYVLTTDYVEIQKGIVERGGEKGELPSTQYDKLSEWLDKLFYPEGVEKS